MCSSSSIFGLPGVKRTCADDTTAINQNGRRPLVSQRPAIRIGAGRKPSSVCRAPYLAACARERPFLLPRGCPRDSAVYPPSPIGCPTGRPDEACSASVTSPCRRLRDLARGGVFRAPRVTTRAVRSYRTFSPLPDPASILRSPRAIGGSFSVALSRARDPTGRVGVTHHRVHVVLGLSSGRSSREILPAAAIRTFADSRSTETDRFFRKALNPRVRPKSVTLPTCPNRPPTPPLPRRRPGRSSGSIPNRRQWCG